MGFRFRKSFNLGPFRWTISKSGIGSSVGFKGFRYTLRADGKKQKTFTVPGTGVSFVDIKKSDSVVVPNDKQIPENNPLQVRGIHRAMWAVIFVLALVIMLLISRFFQ